MKPKKEDSAKKKRLAEKSARIGEPENIFDETVVQEKAPEGKEDQTQVVAADSDEVKEDKVSTKKPRQPRGKKYTNSKQLVKKGQKYAITDALELAKKSSYTSFPGTMEVHLTLADKELRGTLTLPHGTGKTAKVLAFVSSAKSQEARDAKADLVGAEDIVAQIKENKIVPGRDFTAVVATPDMMPVLAPLAKILGPKGMMPNPKTSTVGANIGQMVTNLKKGQFNYKAETPNPYMIHMPMGKVSLTTDQLVENYNAILANFGSGKVKKAYISATMGPGIEIELA
jgi:large subunit ribosomal protein L1